MGFVRDALQNIHESRHAHRLDCIPPNEYIVDMIYNIARNTLRILHRVWREDIIYECTRCEINYTFYMRPVEYAIKLSYSRFQTYIS